MRHDLRQPYRLQRAPALCRSGHCGAGPAVRHPPLPDGRGPDPRQLPGVYRGVPQHFGPGARPLYASKANSFQRIYEIMREEGMGIDVVSSGEIYTALRAGYDLGQAYFHSNNKTDEDIRYSMDHGIGYFVADNVEEIKAIEAEAARRGIKQRVLLRLTPGIDPTPMRPSPPARWTPNSAAPSRPARPRRSPSSPSASPMWSWWASTATWAPSLCRGRIWTGRSDHAGVRRPHGESPWLPDPAA